MQEALPSYPNNEAELSINELSKLIFDMLFIWVLKKSHPLLQRFYVVMLVNV